MSETPEGSDHERLGEFRILSELGRGGMGVVYEAEQPSLNRRVALKVLPPALRNDPRILARFKREAEAAGRLRHPNIVPVFSFGEAGGAPFFAMELVEGVSLDELIRKRRDGEDDRDPEAYRRWAVELVVKIVDALFYAHGRGILHRDVKPANIMVEPDGTPRLTDFGLALDLEATSLTMAGEVFGSPLYMSPEQAFPREQPLDARTDVYSLAVTLYELLTLRIPYDGTTHTEVLTALRAGEIVPPRRADPDLPEPFERVLLHGLERDPDKRYSTAEEFADDLRSLLEGRPVAAPKPRRKRRFSLWIPVGAAALLCVAVALLWPDPGQDESVSPELPDLERLVAGTHPDGAAAMRRWLKPSLRTRNVIARNSSANCSYDLRFTTPQEIPAGVILVETVEISVDTDEWRRAPDPVIHSLGRGGGTSMHSFVIDLRLLLGDTLKRKGFFLGHRVTIRILEPPPGWDEAPPSERPPAETLSGGTSCTWSWEPEAVFVYDEYPQHYPRAVSDPALDPQMERAFTPTEVTLSDVERDSFRLRLLVPSIGGPLPLACEIDVLRPGTGDVAVAQSTWANSGLPPSANRTARRSMVDLPFRLTGLDAELERTFLLDLQAQRLESVRLVLRPSRKVALKEPDFESYWGKTLDVTVPFGTGRRSSERPLWMTKDWTIDAQHLVSFMPGETIRFHAKPRPGTQSCSIGYTDQTLSGGRFRDLTVEGSVGAGVNFGVAVVEPREGSRRDRSSRGLLVRRNAGTGKVDVRLEGGAHERFKRLKGRSYLELSNVPWPTGPFELRVERAGEAKEGRFRILLNGMNVLKTEFGLETERSSIFARGRANKPGLTIYVWVEGEEGRGIPDCLVTNVLLRRLP